MSKETGGPASARPASQDPHMRHEDYEAQEGMTLRDYLAAHCPIPFEMADDYNMSGENPMQFYAAMRYEYADAMIAERAK